MLRLTSATLVAALTSVMLSMPAAALPITIDLPHITFPQDMVDDPATDRDQLTEFPTPRS